MLGYKEGDSKQLDQLTFPSLRNTLTVLSLYSSFALFSMKQSNRTRRSRTKCPIYSLLNIVVLMPEIILELLVGETRCLRTSYDFSDLVEGVI